MGASSSTLHEPVEQLRPETPNLHRAIVSLIEELEAIDWYRQRADACSDDELKAILEHNMNEEIEHASMTLEWIRRNVPKFGAALKLFLFTSGEITAIEDDTKEEKKEEITTPERRSLRFTIGDMKGS